MDTSYLTLVMSCLALVGLFVLTDPRLTDRLVSPPVKKSEGKKASKSETKKEEHPQTGKRTSKAKVA